MISKYLLPYYIFFTFSSLMCPTISMQFVTLLAVAFFPSIALYYTFVNTLFQYVRVSPMNSMMGIERTVFTEIPREMHHKPTNQNFLNDVEGLRISKSKYQGAAAFSSIHVGSCSILMRKNVFLSKDFSSLKILSGVPSSQLFFLFILTINYYLMKRNTH